jgi:hypothetical protein
MKATAAAIRERVERCAAARVGACMDRHDLGRPHGTPRTVGCTPAGRTS